MSTDWKSGYVTNLGYTHGFYRELTPAILRFAALAQGFDTSLNPSGTTTYCELGCGQGFSANLLAAANPAMEVYATDFNPEHIAGAQRLAEAAGTTNVHFHDDSFAEFESRTDLPQFDIIGLHGIYSWIAKEHRQTIVRFIDARLKPGGLVYVSYNSMPGWAHVAPLRQLMRMESMDSSRVMGSEIDNALASIRQLHNLGARHLQTVPGLEARIAHWNGMKRNYLVHEFLNADWTLFYHSDVVSEFSKARLSYVGSADLLEHIDPINLTGDQMRFLQAVPDRTKRETLRDYIVNQQFRRDIFARGAVPITAGEARAKWLDSRFALTTPSDDVPMTIRGALGEATLQIETYRPIIDVFSAAPGALSLRQVEENKKIAAFGWQALQQAITVLVGAGHLQPCMPGMSGNGTRKPNAKSFNMAVAERAYHSAELQYFCAPVIGGAMAVDRFEQLFFLAICQKLADPVAFAWQALKTAGQHLVVKGKHLDGEQENISHLTLMYDAFQKRLPVFKKVGVL